MRPCSSPDLTRRPLGTLKACAVPPGPARTWCTLPCLRPPRTMGTLGSPIGQASDLRVVPREIHTCQITTLDAPIGQGNVWQHMPTNTDHVHRLAAGASAVESRPGAAYWSCHDKAAWRHRQNDPERVRVAWRRQPVKQHWIVQDLVGAHPEVLSGKRFAQLLLPREELDHVIDLSIAGRDNGHVGQPRAGKQTCNGDSMRQAVTQGSTSCKLWACAHLLYENRPMCARLHPLVVAGKTDQPHHTQDRGRHTASLHVADLLGTELLAASKLPGQSGRKLAQHLVSYGPACAASKSCNQKRPRAPHPCSAPPSQSSRAESGCSPFARPQPLCQGT